MALSTSEAPRDAFVWVWLPTPAAMSSRAITKLDRSRQAGGEISGLDGFAT
jgi:hypothetical protein